MPEIVIVGAGPAGLAAAVSASSHGAEVVLLDDNGTTGGQIWRGGYGRQPWFRRLQQSSVHVVTGARVVSGDAHSLLVETEESSFALPYRKLILATGAREWFLPFPGWTLPKIFGVGGLQALTKSGLSLTGKTILVAGTGPFLLAAAAHFRKQGARVPLIAEQTPRGSLIHFASMLIRYPSKLLEAAALRFKLRSTRYLSSCWVENVSDGVAVLRQGSRVWEERFDFLATGYGFRPNTELGDALGCTVGHHGITVNGLQQTSREAIYASGECTGVGGVDLSLIEGRIAGLAASGQVKSAAAMSRRRQRLAAFASHMNEAFRLRPELQGLPQGDTVICRCEDVRWHILRGSRSRREAKLYTRCGMGACQGRICGPILDFLCTADHDRIRPPVFPARLETLATATEKEPMLR